MIKSPSGAIEVDCPIGENSPCLVFWFTFALSHVTLDPAEKATFFSSLNGKKHLRGFVQFKIQPHAIKAIRRLVKIYTNNVVYTDLN